MSEDNTRWDKGVIGAKFGRLTVLNYSHTSKWRQAYFVVVCECKKIKTVRLCSLRSGVTKSCGCFAEEFCSTSSLKHGHSRDGSGSTYRSWMSMNNRCHCESNIEYNRYGGRGITVCDRWKGEEGFANFLKDMGKRPSQKHSLDRYPNNDGNYEPSNCRWATPKEQHRNKSNNVAVVINGETRCLKDWSALYNIKYSTVQARVRKGQSAEVALTTPLERNKR